MMWFRQTKYTALLSLSGTTVSVRHCTRLKTLLSSRCRGLHRAFVSEDIRSDGEKKWKELCLPSSIVGESLQKACSDLQ